MKSRPPAIAILVRSVSILVAGFVGAALGYFAGVLVACFLLWPGSNLCGLLGVFVTAPAGSIAAAALCFWLTRPKTPPHEAAYGRVAAVVVLLGVIAVNLLPLSIGIMLFLFPRRP